MCLEIMGKCTRFNFAGYYIWEKLLKCKFDSYMAIGLNQNFF